MKNISDLKREKRSLPEFCSTRSDRVTVKYISLVGNSEPRYVHQITDHLTLDVDVKLGVGMQTENMRKIMVNDQLHVLVHPK